MAVILSYRIAMRSKLAVLELALPRPVFRSSRLDNITRLDHTRLT
jgi:hypothetical protein